MHGNDALVQPYLTQKLLPLHQGNQVSGWAHLWSYNENVLNNSSTEINPILCTVILICMHNAKTID